MKRGVKEKESFGIRRVKKEADRRSGTAVPHAASYMSTKDGACM